jgi:type I restriction enzyme S subunit
MATDNKNKVLNVPNLRFPEFKEAWKDSNIGKCFDLYSGNTPSRMEKEHFIGDVNWITSGELKEHYIGDTKERISEKAAADNNLRILPVGTFVMAIYGLEAEGVRGTCSITVKTSTISQACMAFTPKSNVSNEFLYSWYKKHGNKIGIRYAQGTKQQNLSYDIIEKFPIRYPSIEEQEKLNTFISLLDSRIATQNKIIEDLKKLKVAIRDKQLNAIRKHYGLNYQICDLLDYEQPTKYAVTDTEYSEDRSKTPVLTANKAFILGYTDENFGVYDNGACIILDDFTLDCKYVDFPFKVKSSAIKILTVKNSYSLRYVYEYLNYLNLETTEHKRHYISEIEPMMIAYPTDKKKIDDFNNMMSSLESKIEIENKYLQSLLAQKSYLLSNMFI